MESNFVCCICHQIPSNVVESSCCNSLFCWDCVVKGKSQMCPNCDQNLDAGTCTENLAVKKIIDSINVNCGFTGCSERFSVSERSAHEATCPYGPTLCPNTELCGIMERRDLPKHLNECQYRRTYCHLCEMPLIVSQLPDHVENECPEAMTECPNHCLTKIKRKNITQHVDTDCPYAEAECPFAQYGCTAKLMRENVESHISDNITSHVKLISTAFGDQQTQINDLKFQLANLQLEVARMTQRPGTLSELDRNISCAVRHVRAANVWNSPLVQSIRSGSPLFQILVGFLAIFFFFHLLRHFTFPAPYFFPPSFIFVLFGFFKFVLGIKLLLLVIRKVRGFVRAVHREQRKILAVVIGFCVFIFLRPLLWLLVM